jgi:organic radical activating enzyme
LHRDFLRAASSRNASVKIVIGDASGVDEIYKVCNIITDVNPATPLFLQPLSTADGGIGISVAHLLRLQEAASARLPDVRVIPQMHRMLGAL